MSAASTSPFLRLMLWAENIIMSRLVPLDNPGPVFGLIFKIPIFFYRIGLANLFSGTVLFLTTTGRKTGRPHLTPLEFRYEPEDDSYILVAGWGGKTDWYRNACANPLVRVTARGRSFESTAEPLTQDEITRLLVESTRLNPGSLAIWSRWAGEALDGSEESLARAAKYFPGLRLRPVKGEE